MGTLEELGIDECLDLLRRQQLGRMAFSTPAGLRIYPLNYTLQDDGILFRTLPFGEVASHATDADVAFSVDDVDQSLRTGWHVLAVGPCRRVEDPGEVRAIRDEADPDPWAKGSRELYFRIASESLTGRRLRWR